MPCAHASLPCPQLKPAHTETQVPVAAALGLSPSDIASTLRSPLVYELRQRLYAKASGAHSLFQAFDVNGDGYLSVKELTECCQQLVPGIGERDVGALCVAADPSGDGHLDYKVRGSVHVCLSPLEVAQLHVEQVWVWG